MTRFRISYTQTEHRHLVVEAADEAEARAMWANGAVWEAQIVDEFDMAGDDQALVAIDALDRPVTS